MKKDSFIEYDELNHGSPPSGYKKPDNIYRCYSCGNTDGFYKYQYPAGDYDIFCKKCESPNTAFDGDGEPECNLCGHLGWECDKCGVMMCEECWEWGKIRDECEYCGAER